MQNLLQRWQAHGTAYFRWVTTPGVAPTYNLAEEALRSVVIDRRLTQGTRGLPGRQRDQRTWTDRCGHLPPARPILIYHNRSKSLRHAKILVHHQDSRFGGGPLPPARSREATRQSAVADPPPCGPRAICLVSARRSRSGAVV